MGGGVVVVGVIMIFPLAAPQMGLLVIISMSNITTAAKALLPGPMMAITAPITRPTVLTLFRFYCCRYAPPISFPLYWLFLLLLMFLTCF